MEQSNDNVVLMEAIKLVNEEPETIVAAYFKDPDGNPLVLAPYQADFIKAVIKRDNTRFIYKACTQSGKSLCISVLLALIAILYPNEKIVNVSYTEQQARIIFDQVKKFLVEDSPVIRQMVDLSRSIGSTKEFSKTRMFMKNGTEIRVLSTGMGETENVGNTLLGMSASVLCIDEASSIPNDVFTTKILRMLGGKRTSGLEKILILSSTPQTSNFFEDAWHDPNYVKFTVNWKTAVDEGRLDLKTVEEQRRKMTKSQFASWYDAEFPSMLEDSVFDMAECERNLVEPDPIFKGEKILSVDVARFGCFDDETKILTKRGWKLFSEINKNEDVLSSNGKEVYWEKIILVQKYFWEGNINYCHNEKWDFALTDNHRFYICENPKKRDTELVKTFSELPRISVLKNYSGWIGSNPQKMIFESFKKMPNGGYHKKIFEFDFFDWCEFLGWFISEGCVYKEKRENGRYRILIAQTTSSKMTEIETLLKRMNIVFRTKNNQIEFSNNEMGKHLIEHCGVGAENKKIPNYLKESTPEAIEKFLTSFVKGDGHKNKKGSNVFFSSSFLLLEDIQEMLVKIGRAGKISKSSERGSIFYIGQRKVVRLNDNFVLYSLKNPKNKWLDKKNVYMKPYSGFVYCISTPSDRIVVKRNGKPMWTGNSDFTVYALVDKLGEEFRVVDFIQDQKKDLMTVTGRIVNLNNEHKFNKILVDESGLGSGIVDRLREQGVEVTGVIAGSKCTNGAAEENCSNLKAELYMKAKKLFEEDKLKIINKGTIMKELRQSKKEFTSNGKLKIIDPDKSPDYLSSLVYSLYDPNYGTFVMISMGGEEKKRGF